MQGVPVVVDIQGLHLNTIKLGMACSSGEQPQCLSFSPTPVASFHHPQSRALCVQGVPVVVDIQGLHLNTSMDGNPLITPLQMSVQDWGRFQSPGGAWEECPYRRVAPQGAPGSNATAEGSRQEGLEGEGSHVASRKLYAQPASR